MSFDDLFFSPRPLSTIPTEPPVEVKSDHRIAAESLGERLQGLAAARTQLDHEFLTALAEFDAMEGWTEFTGITSTAHWLGWACSIAPGTAREQVRVARGLNRLPEVSARMADGVLSYSKVREITRLLPEEPLPEEPPEASDEPASTDLGFDENRLCELAVEMTASQLARTIRAYRHLPGSRLQAQAKRHLAWRNRDDGLLELRVLVPADEAALIRAAIDTAHCALTSADGEERSMVDALLLVASASLEEVGRQPVDDHHLVTVVVDGETLTAPEGDVPAGTSRCEVAGAGGIEPATARRLSCEARVLGALVDGRGEVLDLGRARRTVTKGQRRALRVRDGHCQFPGCAQERWLKAHHVVHWADGGPTDLANLVLLCHFHHLCVHEGGIRMRPGDDGGPARWEFVMPDGTVVDAQHRWSDDALLGRLSDWALGQAARADYGRGFPPHGGAGFDLFECVGAMIGMAA